jgi:hypothetical protein
MLVGESNLCLKSELFYQSFYPTPQKIKIVVHDFFKKISKANLLKAQGHNPSTQEIYKRKTSSKIKNNEKEHKNLQN